MRARRNRGPEPGSYKLTVLDGRPRDARLGKVYDHATRWAWGIEPRNLIEITDPDLPDFLVECGRLVELRVRLPGDRRMTYWTFSGIDQDESHVMFDPNHVRQRLYLYTTRAVRAQHKAWWTESSRPPMDLNDLADKVGGPQALGDYPEVPVKYIGILMEICYGTRKQDDYVQDGQGSIYVHKLSEESNGPRPAIGVDRLGRLWLAGGSYRVTDAGIED